MPWILVAESEGRYAERVRDALAADGWQVETVPSVAAALAAAAARAPEIVIASAELSGARDLLGRFARHAGGSGAVALLPELGGADEVARAADEALAKPFTEQQLRLAVRRLATAGRAPKAAPPAAADSGERLTSQDLFGDVLAEMGEEAESAAASTRAPALPPPIAAPPPPAAAPPPPAARPGASTDVDKALERTLSGLLKGEKPKPAATPRKADAGVDDLISRTLSGLDAARRPPAAKPPAAAPPAPEPARPHAEPPAASVPVAPAKPPEAKPPARAPEEPSVDWLLDAVKLPMPRTEPRRSSREIDLAELEVLAHPKPERKESETPTPRRPESFGTQRVAIPPALRSRPSATEFGQYTLLERIAVGGMAEVWKARMKGVEGFQKTVAIKKILPHLTDSSDFVSMFVDEAKLAAQLTHNNIIHIYDLGKIGDDYFIAMEFVDGRDLRTILNTAREKSQALPMGLALLVASRLASALDYAHRMKDFESRPLGLVHRDVSPQNVLISFEGDIKLCDFGIVKAVSKASKTQMGALKGKLQYMSPEQAWGRPVDARSDIFSLGSLLFEMLTGRRLFPGDSEMSVLDAVREGRIQAPRDLDPRLPLEVNALVLRALAKEPGDRFESAGAMQREVDSILGSLKPPPSAHELSSYMRRLFGVEGRPEAAAAPTAPPPTPAAAPAASAAAPTSAPAPAGGRPASVPLAAAPAAAPMSGFDDALAEAPAGGKNLLWFGLAALAVLAVAAWFLFGRGGTPAPPPAPDAGSTAPAAVEAPAPPAPEGSPAAAPAPADAATPDAAVSKIVDDEVKRRQDELRRQYEAEVAKKQQELAAATAPATTAAAAPEAPPAAAPAATEPAPTAPPVAPVQEPASSAPEPEPAPPTQPATEPAPIETEPAPAPEPAAPQPTVKAGDLVQPGPGVRIPVLVSIDKPEYPPLARRMKVEGTVVLSLLVDERGRVLEVKLERGVQLNVGINEAAIAAARSAKFRPATKEGVPVKIWYQLTIPFKL
jgi:TonB family protein